MIAQTLLVWLVLYLSFFALVGFVLFVSRGATGRPRSGVGLVRASSLAAFGLALVAWLLLRVWPS